MLLGAMTAQGRGESPSLKHCHLQVPSLANVLALMDKICSDISRSYLAQSVKFTLSKFASTFSNVRRTQEQGSRDISREISAHDMPRNVMYVHVYIGPSNLVRVLPHPNVCTSM